MTTPIETHLANVRQAEADRQRAMSDLTAGAVARASPSDAAQAARDVDIAYHRRRLASAIATGCSVSVSSMALKSLGAELVESPPLEPWRPGDGPPDGPSGQGPAAAPVAAEQR